MTFPLRAATVAMLSLIVIAPVAVHADVLNAAIAGPATADGDLTVAFDGSASTGNIVQYVWDFGHGTAPVTTTVPSVSHRFGAYGRFHVTLTVHDNVGAIDSANLTIETNGFGPDNYRVTPIYFVPTNRTPALDWEAKFQTAMELISRFYAENLEMNGFGHRPLNMELGANGRPVIRLVVAQHEDAYYLPYGSYNVGGAQAKIQQELEAITDLEEQECLMVIGDVHWYNPTQKGNIGPWTGGRAFPGRGCFSVATNPFRWLGTTVAEQMVIFDDPTWDAEHGPTTRGQNASTAMGGMAHELGHGFGMQHTPFFNDIMALGLYEFRDYFVPVPYGGIADLSRTTAMGFDNLAFFRSDHPFADNSDPTITMLPPLALRGQPLTIPVEIGDTGGSDPALLHVYFQFVTWDSIDVRGLGSSFTLPYTFPGSETLDNGLYAYGAMIYDGDSNRKESRASFQVVDSIPPSPPPIAVDPTEWVWGEDGLPTDASTTDHWAWQTTIKNSGEMALYQESTSAQPAFGAWYGDYPNPLHLSPGDQVSAYLYITPGSSLDGVAIELGAWYGGGIRLVWGDNPYPPLWAPTAIRIGDVPPAGGWVHLTVPASLFITAPERYTNMALRAHGTGVLFWDRLGKVPSSAVCGNGVIETPESCDDGDVTPGDGCDGSCVVEPGFACAGTPSTCTIGCGNGIIAGSEACDDGGGAAGDGCDPTCQLEPGWTCAGAPTSCAPICGDHYRVGGEACDDGNTNGGDCCAANCQFGGAGNPCPDDGDACTVDSCTANGVCQHTFYIDLCQSPSPPPIPVDPQEWVWAEDDLPADALTIDQWVWQTTVKNSGERAAYQESTSAQPAFGAWYGDYPNPLHLSPGDQVSAYLYITPGSSLAGVAIELGAWYGGGIRLFWGDNPYPPLWAPTAIRIGDVPPAGGWVRLTVPASLFITAPERYTNMALRAHGTGVLFWDRLGRAGLAVCGDGFIAGSEACDDGAVAAGDGCDPTCQLESGWTCAGVPTSCAPICGDNHLVGGETCDDGNAANGDCCDADCQLDPAGSPCDDDGDLCSNDTCDAGGVCQHAVAPDASCLLPTTSGKAQLRIVGGSRAQVQLKWTKGPVVPKATFGTPSSGVPQYTLCVYDHIAGAPTAVVKATAVGDADCSDKTCWTESKSGWRLKSATGASDGIVQLQLTKSKLHMKLKGGFLTLPTLPLAADPSVIAQVRSSDGQCYGAVFSTPVKNGTDGYRAKSD